METATSVTPPAVETFPWSDKPGTPADTALPPVPRWPRFARRSRTGHLPLWFHEPARLELLRRLNIHDEGETAMRTWQALWNDEAGLIITAELIMLITILVTAIAVGWQVVANLMVEELEDIANAAGQLDQSYGYRGLSIGNHAFTNGSGFFDTANSVNIQTNSGNPTINFPDFTPLIPVIETPVIPAVPDPGPAIVDEDTVTTEPVIEFDDILDGTGVRTERAIQIDRVRRADGAIEVIEETLETSTETEAATSQRTQAEQICVDRQFLLQTRAEVERVRRENEELKARLRTLQPTPVPATRSN